MDSDSESFISQVNNNNDRVPVACKQVVPPSLAMSSPPLSLCHFSTVLKFHLRRPTRSDRRILLDMSNSQAYYHGGRTRAPSQELPVYGALRVPDPSDSPVPYEPRIPNCEDGGSLGK